MNDFEISRQICRDELIKKTSPAMLRLQLELDGFDKQVVDKSYDEYSKLFLAADTERKNKHNRRRWHGLAAFYVGSIFFLYYAFFAYQTYYVIILPFLSLAVWGLLMALRPKQ